MNRKQAQAIVAKESVKRARKNGRKEPTILDTVPIVMTREYLATLRKAFGIRA
jgi:hypothetical protein